MLFVMYYIDMLVLVTTSLCQDWVVCAPAAFLRCGSRSLSTTKLAARRKSPESLDRKL